MGRRKDTRTTRSHTLPSSPTHSFSSSSSSDFEFTISLSPRKSSAANLCPADELFYKGQLLPLHLSPRISMVRTLLLASSSTSSSSDTTTTASRDSTGSSNDSHSSFSSELLLPECDSSRPSSVTDQDDEYKRLTHLSSHATTLHGNTIKKPNKYFSLSRFSSVFRKDTKTAATRNLDSEVPGSGSGSMKRMSNTAREVIRKYLKKVKPLYEKLSQNQKQQQHAMKSSKAVNVTMNMMKLAEDYDGSIRDGDNNNGNNRKENSNSVNASISHSFSGNLRYPRRRRSCVSSCPSSMRSSPSHSGILSKNGFPTTSKSYQDSSSMEELQSAIQGAIAHCKNSMMQNNDNKTMVSHEI